jgi:palmitoyltransferase ZDHHC13/17
MGFSIALVIGAWQFDYIVYTYISDLVDYGVKFDPSLQIGECLFGQSACAYLQSDFWTISIGFWAFLQTIWVLFLVISQSYQIMIAYTTNEAVNYRRFDYLTHPDDITAPAYRKRSVNPFNIGFIGNCIDFWSNGSGELKDVSWFAIYDVPPYLMNKALRRNGYARISNADSKSIDHIV